jgi:hypothetical protein
MAKKGKAKKQDKPPVAPDQDQPALTLQRRTNGTFAKGFSGSITSDAARARRTLNASTLAGMQWAYDKYGRQAIEKVAKTQPAIFLKMLVLLVPRELEVTHSQGTKGMSDEQLEAAVMAIEGFLARRSGEQAKVIEGTVDATQRDIASDKPAETSG